jgi:hypothetical protein
VNQDKLRQTRVFASRGIYGLCSAFRCIRGVEHRSTIFYARVGPVQIPQKAHQDALHRSCVLHPVGSVGHVVHCGASGARNIDALFFLLRWDRYGFQKKRVDTRHAKCLFFQLLGYAGHIVHSGASGVQNIDTLIFMLVWDRYIFHRETSTQYFSCSAFQCLWGTKRPLSIFHARAGLVRFP